jgi:hypothetical protein
MLSTVRGKVFREAFAAPATVAYFAEGRPAAQQLQSD